MTSIAKQNTIEALTIYHKAQKKEWAVRVVDGNVRVATWTEHLGSRIKNYFNPSRERTNWNQEAELAIKNKLLGEVSLFKEKEINLNSVASLFRYVALRDIKKPQEDLLELLKNDHLLIENEKIKELWQIKDKKMYGLVVEELIHAKDQNLKKATEVAQYTLNLIKKFGFSKSTALNTARNIFFAIDAFNIESDKAFELFQISLDLVKKGHLDKKLPLKLQLSASLAFIQLTEKKIDRDTALTTVKNRIDKLKKIQNKIPKEMQIDCVHEGKDYEYRVSFSKEQKEKIAESLKTQLKEPLYKKNKVIEEKLKDLSNIHLMNRLDDQSILDGERSSSSFRENGKIISTLNSDPQSNSLKIEEKYESNGFIEVDEEYEIPQNTITNPDSNIRDIPESLLETKFLNPLKNFQIKTKLNDKNLTDISHFLSQTTLGTLIGFELEKLKSHVQSTSSKKRGETFYDVDFLTEKTKEGNTRIILKATKYEDGDSLMIDNADPNDPSTTLLPINEFFNYEKDDKVGPQKFRQKMNVDFEIQINQNDEIQIRVIDAGLVNKFSIDYDLLDTTPIDEIFK